MVQCAEGKNLIRKSFVLYLTNMGKTDMKCMILYMYNMGMI